MKPLGLDLGKLDTEGEPSFQSVSDVKEVMIPLKGGFGSVLPPSVDVGDKVKVGTALARNDDSISTPVHSSVNGEVVEIVEMEHFHEETLETLPEKIPGVKVKTFSNQEIGGTGVDWEKEKPQNLRKLLYLAGLTSFGQTGIPTEFNSSYFSPDDVEKIVVNGVKKVPFVNHLINYDEELSPFKTGLNIISSAFPNAELHFGLDHETYETLNPLNSSQQFTAHSVKGESYMGEDKILAGELFEQSWDQDGYLLDQGILVLPEIVPLSVQRAIEEEVPFTRNRFSLAGPGTESTILEAPLGALLGDIVDGYIRKDQGYLNIMGGPLSGIKLESLNIPLGKELASLIRLNKPEGSEVMAWLKPGLSKKSYSKAFLSSLVPGGSPKVDSGLHGEERPCISCGYCSDICPADILPYQLYRTFSHDLVDEVNRLQPQRCVDCGLCSYVCPSKLPLSQTIKQAKIAQPGAVHNYVEYEEAEQGLAPIHEIDAESDRGEEG